MSPQKNAKQLWIAEEPHNMVFENHPLQCHHLTRQRMLWTARPSSRTNMRHVKRDSLSQHWPQVIRLRVSWDMYTQIPLHSYWPEVSQPGGGRVYPVHSRALARAPPSAHGNIQATFTCALNWDSMMGTDWLAGDAVGGFYSQRWLPQHARHLIYIADSSVHSPDRNFLCIAHSNTSRIFFEGYP